MSSDHWNAYTAFHPVKASKPEIFTPYRDIPISNTRCRNMHIHRPRAHARDEYLILRVEHEYSCHTTEPRPKIRTKALKTYNKTFNWKFNKNLSCTKQKQNTKCNNRSNHPHNQQDVCCYSSPKKAAAWTIWLG